MTNMQQLIVKAFDEGVKAAGAEDLAEVRAEVLEGLGEEFSKVFPIENVSMVMAIDRLTDEVAGVRELLEGRM